ELLSPWFGIKEPEYDEQENKLFETPEVITKHIEQVITEFASATPQNLGYKELNWTVRSMAQVLYALGVSKRERDEIVKEWVNRAGVNISEARLRDILDRLDVAGRKDFFLGPVNWQRLNENLGVKNTPPAPWEYKFNRTQSLNLVGSLWRNAWRAIERARSREEARGEMEKRAQDEKRMRRREKEEEREQER
ncbi:hypothetical protein, partial [Desulfotruncus alcoholivorax]|uniref:hypothetical protein n=1 Tax=Desulfotruncus alcoholivorax TaxID=265477 RepID=UPI00054D0D2E